MKTIIAVASIAMLAGCGTVAKSTGAMQVGPDTYRIMARASVGNQMESQKMAFSEANSHCSSLGRKMVTTNTRSTQYEGYELTFRCLKDGDPDLVRPVMQKAPDTVIQVK